MDGSYPRKARAWDESALAVQDLLALGAKETPSSALAGPHNPEEFAQRLYAHEALAPAAPLIRPPGEVEPYSLQWFLNIEQQRYSRQGRWIPRLLEFAKHSGETLLGLGDGLGTDWVQYARHGARVITCAASTSQLSLIRRNFELRGLKGRFIHAQPACLPLETASIDVACVSSLGPDPRLLVDEVYRVLKPGGKVLAVTPAYYDVDYWFHTMFFWYRWLSKRHPRAGLAETRFSGRELRRLFGRFVEHRIHKRQLRRREVPHVWRWLPLSVLARLMGRALILKAFKPLSAAIGAQAIAA
jgi:SAM-dependent methyltransferase